MRNLYRISFILVCISVALIPTAWADLGNHGFSVPDPFDDVFEQVLTDTIPPLKDRAGNWIEETQTNPFDLNDPASIEKNVEYDPESGLYIITEKIGDEFYRAPTYMTFEEYMDWSAAKQQKDYFNRLAGISTGDRNGSGNIDPVATVDISEDIIDRLFGGNEVDLKPQGNVDLTFGVDYYKQDNPILPLRRQRNGGFDFDMDIQVNVDGKIGEKLSTAFNYNTKSTFDFENKLKLNYDSDLFSEDEIIKGIEAGDVSLPLRSSLIEGSQSLFGLKTELQFGHLRLTAIASQQRSEQNDLTIQGGSLLQEFEVPIDQYDENRHFFLSHFNRNTFEGALANIPQINSLFQVTRIEVWVTNDKNQTTNVRDIVAIADIGEWDRMTNDDPDRWRNPNTRQDICKIGILPTNNVNFILGELRKDSTNRKIDRAVTRLNGPGFGFKQIKDYEKVRARKLNTQEFSYNASLGTISLNIRLRPDQVLGVGYEYIYNGEVFQVGELAQDIPNVDTSQNQQVLFVKMLKSTNASVKLPYWDLMMKNFYYIGGSDINPEEFELDIFYEDPGLGFKRFLPASANVENLPLITLLNMDNLNVQGDPIPDGRFDFAPGLTIDPRQGRIMFPVLEPFGSSFEQRIIAAGGDPAGLIYNQLYDSTVVKAREVPEFNRFTIKGKSQSSSSSEISLGAFNIPPGSVRVTAGGQRLVENVDYIVDYNIGRLRILNDTYLQPGTPIRVSFEDNALFSFQKKTMIGLRADYEVNEHLALGGTYMHLFERPFTQKVNIGDDPINNRIYGLDLNYSNEAPFITKLVDAIPGIDTKAKSNVTFQAEVAALKPGHSKAINAGKGDKDGVVYLDDFEGTSSNFDLRTPTNIWQLSSVPTMGDVNIDGMPDRPEAEFNDSLVSNANRAMLNWYRIDRTARGVSDGASQDPYTQGVNQQEIFPDRSRRPGLNDFRTFDLAFYPDQRGPYNFDLPGGYPGVSAGIGCNEENNTITLNNPESRWAGISRELTTTDFEQANIEAVEFWLCDPFINDAGGNNGKLVLNLGTVSEDILKDSRLFYEDGLPRNEQDGRPDTTAWGYIPRIPSIVHAFDTDLEARERQDVGLDGLSDANERIFFGSYLEALQAGGIPFSCIQKAQVDPANDNFAFFLNEDEYPRGTDLFTRYSKYNGTDGNSPTSTSQLGNVGGFGNSISASTNVPDTEDLNGDNSISETEAYLEHVVDLQRNFSPSSETGNLIGDKYVTDIKPGQNGRTWYRFRVPLTDFAKKGEISDFRSIRFIRMYMTGFSEKAVLRFATLDLVRNQWRRLNREQFCSQDNTTVFAVDAVNIEEHSQREPFPYTIPRGIQREQIIGSTYQDIFQNEQSLSLKFEDFSGDCRQQIYKILNLDMRVFEKLQMFVHAESAADETLIQPWNDGDLSLFLRLGSDFENNYYEYEIPLVRSKDRTIPIAADEYKDEVWKLENEVLFALSQLTDLKIQRNADPAGSPAERYSINFPNQAENAEFEPSLSIKGNPTLGYVKNVMIGIKANTDNPMTGEVWVNELRLVGLEEKGGVAALARLDADLADFGTFGAATSYKSIGWGAIDEKLDDRAKESVTQFDVSTNLELGKFFGPNAGIRIPFYYQYSTTVIKPRFDPIDLDLDLKDKLNRIADQDDRDSVRNQALDVATLKQMNFTNVKKERTGDGKPMPWSISNFSASYSYSKATLRNEIVEKDELRHHRGSLDYNYSLPSKYLQPFKGLSKSKWLALLTELNFNPLPSSFTFSTILDRRLGRRDYRFSVPAYKTWFDKRFTWDRNYALKWDFTKSLKFNFNASNQAVIDELPEYRDRLQGEFYTKQEKQDVIKQNLRDFGRTKNYSHNVRASYQVPTKHFPLLDFVRADLSYDAGYSWTAASLNTDSLGNVIQNNQTRQATLDLDFTKLYNKSKFLAKINRSARPGGQRGATKTKADSKAKKDAPKGDKKAKKEKGKKKEAEPGVIARVLLRPLMSIRKLRLNYSQTFGTVIPGFTPSSRLLGMSNNWSAPGWDFISGLQPTISRRAFEENDFLMKARDNDWITTNAFQSRAIEQSQTENLDGRLTIEPFRDFKLDINVNRNYTDNFSMYYKTTEKGTPDNPNTSADLARLTPRQMGSFTMSYFSLQTLFMGSESEINALFKKFETNRSIISRQRGEGEPHPEDGSAYDYGFGRKQQDVLVPAFISAYTNKDPANFDLDETFDWLPRPNWQLTYNGLHKTNLFKDIFSSIRLTHGYKSTLSLNTYQSNLNYDDIVNGEIVGQRNQENLDTVYQNYYSRYILPSVRIEESFSPLIGFEFKTKNDINFSFDYSKRRGLALGFVSNELAEDRATSFDVSFGWVMKNVELSWLPGYKKNQKKKKKSSRSGTTGGKDPQDDSNKGPVSGSDLELSFDFSFTDNITLNHYLDQETQPQPTRGSRDINISPSVKYDLNKNVNLRLFFDYRMTKPYISTGFPITTTEGGVTIQIVLD